MATFYENFSLTPKGKYVIKCCDGTACHVRKSIPILEKLRSELLKCADALSAKRNSAAEKIERGVNEELKFLDMEKEPLKYVELLQGETGTDYEGKY